MLFSTIKMGKKLKWLNCTMKDQIFLDTEMSLSALGAQTRWLVAQWLVAQLAR